jgi:hypothetical protein
MIGACRHGVKRVPAFGCCWFQAAQALLPVRFSQASLRRVFTGADTKNREGK